MAVVNISDDSFSGDGKSEPTKALKFCEKQISAGADIIDLGAQSSRPGAEPISTSEEWRRLQPILKEVVNWHIPISVDTYKSEIIEKSLALDVDIINNIYGFRSDDGNQNQLSLVSNSKVAIVIMHMQGTPQTMQRNPVYQDLEQDIKNFFQCQLDFALECGISRNRLIFDLGFGFGKKYEDNVNLFKKIPNFVKIFSPILIGVSRKSMIGNITRREPKDRAVGSVVAALLAIQNGAKLIRVHDVGMSLDAINIYNELN